MHAWEKEQYVMYVRIKDHATLIDSIVIINTNLRYVDWLSGEHFVFISLLKGIIFGKKKKTIKKGNNNNNKKQHINSFNYVSELYTDDS